MKLSSFLRELGKVVAYYPDLNIRLIDSVPATLLFCQFMYWLDKTNDRDGWIYKTSDELREETGLSYYQQKSAREQLKQLGILEEKRLR